MIVRPFLRACILRAPVWHLRLMMQRPPASSAHLMLQPSADCELQTCSYQTPNLRFHTTTALASSCNSKSQHNMTSSPLPDESGSELLPGETCNGSEQVAKKPAEEEFVRKDHFCLMDLPAELRVCIYSFFRKCRQRTSCMFDIYLNINMQCRTTSSYHIANSTTLEYGGFYGISKQGRGAVLLYLSQLDHGYSPHITLSWKPPVNTVATQLSYSCFL
jgi:hypothetical protein